jgi:hypothetical protein
MMAHVRLHTNISAHIYSYISGRDHVQTNAPTTARQTRQPQPDKRANHSQTNAPTTARQTRQPQPDKRANHSQTNAPTTASPTAGNADHPCLVIDCQASRTALTKAPHVIALRPLHRLELALRMHHRNTARARVTLHHTCMCVRACAYLRMHGHVNADAYRKTRVRRFLRCSSNTHSVSMHVSHHGNADLYVLVKKYVACVYSCRCKGTPNSMTGAQLPTHAILSAGYMCMHNYEYHTCESSIMIMITITITIMMMAAS